MFGALIAIGIVTALVGGYIGLGWFRRHFRGEPNDPNGAESAVYLVVGGAYALFVVVTLLGVLAFELLSRLRWI